MCRMCFCPYKQYSFEPDWCVWILYYNSATSKLFLLFCLKERTNMAAPWNYLHIFFLKKHTKKHTHTHLGSPINSVRLLQKYALNVQGAQWRWLWQLGFTFLERCSIPNQNALHRDKNNRWQIWLHFFCDLYANPRASGVLCVTSKALWWRQNEARGKERTRRQWVHETRVSDGVQKIK